MNITQLTVGQLQVNCYIIQTQLNGAIVIDAGANAQGILSFVEKNGLTLKAIMYTHGHFDHVGAVNELKEKTGAPVYIHTEDEELLVDPKKSFGSFYGMFKSFDSIKPDVLMNDDDIIVIDDVSIKVMHTPGHTKGSCVFIFEDIIFSGDTLFYNSIGRADLYGGNMITLQNSLLKIATLEGDYKILPGHGEHTSLSYEKKTNPYIR